MNELFSLRGKRALVTGGTRGIGRAIAMRFAEAGALVIANYVRDDAAAESFQNEAEAAGCKVVLCRADITTPKGIENVLSTVGSDDQKLSIFVHCAATGVHKPVDQLNLRHFDWTYALNVRAFFDLVQRLLPRFDSSASILAISSEGATRAVPYYSLVGSSKGALESLVRHFAVELAPRGIRVNALAAGTVLTDAWKVLPDSERRLAEAAERSPIGRLNSLDEIAWAAQFLCSAAGNGIVGHTLVVDGGRSVVV
jgi:enoyl-[acyl-carrier protein] reductase III